MEWISGTNLLCECVSKSLKCGEKNYDHARCAVCTINVFFQGKELTAEENKTYFL